MSKIFGKEILADQDITINGELFELYICDGGDYIDIHILDETFKRDDLNTLKLQDQKEFLKEWDKNKMILCIYDHFIWKKHNLSVYIKLEEDLNIL